MADGCSSEKFYKKPKKVKCEFEDFPEDNHSHNFLLKFDDSADRITGSCSQLQTVLEVIKSQPVYKQNIKYGDEHIVVQKGEALKGTAVATHFPCSCLEDKELITLFCKNDKVEELKEPFDRTVLPKEDYVLFYIDTRGGINTKTIAQKKQGLFRSSAMKEFNKLCVCGKKGMTVKEAIERDGRFSDSLGQFKLSDVAKDKMYTYYYDKIDQHHGKTFRICLETGNRGTFSKAENVAKLKALAKPRSVRLGAVLKKAQTKGGQAEIEITKLYKTLRDQFPRLREELLRRFPGNSFQKALDKIDFGKVQQSFSDVYRLKKLLKLGKSVCKLIVGSAVEGTAFVLFNRYILTNKHIFKNFMHKEELKHDVEIFALFNHENPSPTNNSYYFHVKSTFIDQDEKLDYAILELDPCGEEENKVPPGLLKEFSPMPEMGEACIIGHPGGGIKRFDPTCVIEKERRVEEVNKQLEPHLKNMITLMSVVQLLKDQGIENIFTDSNLSSYHTFMFHGSSGSPVFDGECKVFGLHSSGFVYGFPQAQVDGVIEVAQAEVDGVIEVAQAQVDGVIEVAQAQVDGVIEVAQAKAHSVIEVAQPVLLIFERFVTKLKKNDELLRQVEKGSKGNKWLKEILAGAEPMDTD